MRFEVQTARDKTIEECALVADQWEDSKEFGYDPTAVQIAAAIRALKK